MRIEADDRLGILDLDPLQEFDRAAERLALGDGAMGADGLDDLVADGEDGIERGHRILEDHRRDAAADRGDAALVSTEHVGAAERHALRRDAGRRLAQEAHQRLAGDRFSRAGFADDAEAFAAFEMEADAAHRLDQPFMLAEADREILDFDKRHRLPSLTLMVEAGGRPWGEPARTVTPW